ncbi:uncharacterized protein ACOB8E_020416 isoform 2-T3 [Sarcophilus harrisii]
MGGRGQRIQLLLSLLVSASRKKIHSAGLGWISSSQSGSSCLPIEALDSVHSSRSDLREIPLENPDGEWFTDRPQILENGERKAGYFVVTLHSALEAKPLSPGTSAQKAKFIAMTRALELGKGRRVNIYTDSKYAFHILHAHGTFWEERGLLTTKNPPIKHAGEILHLLQAVHEPMEISVLFCKGHQKGDSLQDKGNRLENLTAKAAVHLPLTMAPLIPQLPDSFTPSYSSQEKALAGERGYILSPSGCFQRCSDHLLIPEASQWKLIFGLHQATHLGRNALQTLVKCIFTGHKLGDAIKHFPGCPICAQVNPEGAIKPLPLLESVQKRGTYPD